MPSNDELQDQLRSLSLEVRSLRDEVERLKGAAAPSAKPAPFEPIKASPLPPTRAPSAPKPPEPRRPLDAAPPVAAPTTFEDLVRKAKGLPPEAHDARPPAAFSYSADAPGTVVKPSEPVIASFEAPSWDGFTEKFIGEKMLQYVGTLILGLGVVFFLVWRAQHTNPAERAFMAAAAGAVLVGLGAWARSKPPYDKVAGALIGGGWSILYITAYAVYHFPPVKVVDSPAVAMTLMLLAAGGMIAHALSTGSRAFRLYAFGLAYALLLFCRSEIATFDIFLLLLLASAAIAVESGEADVLIPSLIGFHLNYIPVYLRTIGLSPAEHTRENFLQPFAWLAGGYLIVALMPFIPRTRARLKTETQGGILDAALCLNMAAFALMAGSMGRVYFGHASLPRAALLALFFLIPAIGHLYALGKRSSAASLGGVIPLALLAAAVFEMPDPMWKLLAWVGVSTGWVFIGLFLEQPVWRAAGLAMSIVTFLFYAEVARVNEESRRAAAGALFIFSAIAYFFSRFHRLWLAEPEEWEHPATEYWLYIGTASLILGLWGMFDAAPFLCCLVALSIAGEHLAIRLGRTHLWVQASLLEVGFGGYSFFVDYGAGSSVTALSPRVLVSGVVLMAYAYLLFADPMDETVSSKWEVWSREGQRRLLSWLMFAVAVFMVYRELDARMRLPVWAFGSLLLYWLGRTTKHEDFTRQSVLLAMGTGAEALTTYWSAPSIMMPVATTAHAALYWSSIGALIGGLFVAKSPAEGGGTDDQAAAMFSVLALVMGAAYLGKELDRVQLTLAWTGLGIAFLGGGLVLGWRELRLPGLALLGICVGKALLSDTAHMPLPNRVASFVALGVVLIFASTLYNRAGAQGGG